MSPVAALGAALRGALSGKPGQLRAVSALAVIAALVAGIGAGFALRERSGALSEAKQAAAHLVLVQRAQIELVQADADASNAYLGFGKEPMAQRLDYLASVTAASRDMATAAQASPRDAAVLAGANAALTRYTAYQASARAYNSRGVLVGASYLATASELLRSDVTAPLQTLSGRDAKTVAAAYARSTRALWWFLLSVLIGLGGLLAAQVWLGRTFRRIINVPIAVCSVVLLLALVAGAGAMSLAQSRADDVRSGPLAKATALSRSRVAAFDAKSNESLTVIKRGSATPKDNDWSDAIETATSSLPSGNTEAAKALASYATKHKALNALDVAGEWTAAKNAVTATTGSSANAQFQIYAAKTRSALVEQSAAASSGLDSAGNVLLPAGLLVLAAGLLAAAGALWGFSLRLDEYR